MNNDTFTGNAADKIPMILLVLVYFIFIVFCLVIKKYFVKKDNCFMRYIVKLD